MNESQVCTMYTGQIGTQLNNTLPPSGGSQDSAFRTWYFMVETGLSVGREGDSRF